MNDKPTLQDLLEIQQHFGLPSPALVEKDWHVVRALAAIAAADTAPFRLVFGGGTALCRAHGLMLLALPTTNPPTPVPLPIASAKIDSHQSA